MTDRERFFQLLEQHFTPKRPFPSDLGERLWLHYDLMCQWNKVLNLTSIGNMQEAVIRHYCESLFLAELMPAAGVSVMDLGSGPGLPGIPMAAALPGNRILLCESHQRKAVFLKEATRSYGNVQVLARRAEEVTERVDWVVSRAVRPVAVVKVARRLRASVGLLMGEGDLGGVTEVAGFDWQAPMELPWGERRIALLGTFHVEHPPG